MLVGRGPDRGSATPELVKLRGARFVVADEPEAGARLRESHVKALTGSDRITARALYSDPIEFDPTFTLALVTNHRPAVQGTDAGIWRRLLLIPFTVTIPPADQDPDLAMKLAAEADGILSWAIAGCLEWQDRGLDPPVAVTAATDDYRTEQDHVASFIDDECFLPSAHPEHACTRRKGHKGVEPVLRDCPGPLALAPACRFGRSDALAQ